MNIEKWSMPLHERTHELWFIIIIIIIIALFNICHCCWSAINHNHEYNYSYCYIEKGPRTDSSVVLFFSKILYEKNIYSIILIQIYYSISNWWNFHNFTHLQFSVNILYCCEMKFCMESNQPLQSIRIWNCCSTLLLERFGLQIILYNVNIIINNNKNEARVSVIRELNMFTNVQCCYFFHAWHFMIIAYSSVINWFIKHIKWNMSK